MRSVKFSVVEDRPFATTIMIEDDDAAKAVSQLYFTGFNLKDAIRNANKRLNLFAYCLEEV